jgi:hypothetical protein
MFPPYYSCIAEWTVAHNPALIDLGFEHTRELLGSDMTLTVHNNDALTSLSSWCVSSALFAQVVGHRFRGLRSVTNNRGRFAVLVHNNPALTSLGGFGNATVNRYILSLLSRSSDGVWPNRSASSD